MANLDYWKKFIPLSNTGFWNQQYKTSTEPTAKFKTMIPIGMEGEGEMPGTPETTTEQTIPKKPATIVTPQMALDKISSLREQIRRIQEAQQANQTPDETEKPPEEKEPAIPPELYEGEGEGETSEEDSGMDDLIDYYQKQLESNQNEFDAWKDKMSNSYTAYDNLTADLVNTITNTYAARIKTMEDLNMRATENIRTYGYRAGTMRYSKGIAMGLVNAEERAGQMRISQLEAQRDQAIAEVKMALEDKKYSVANDMIDLVNERRKEIKSEFESLLELAQEENEEIEDRRRQVEIDSQVAFYWSQGQITDPVELYNLVNPLKADGTRSNDITMKEITDITKTLPEYETEEDWRAKQLTPDQAVTYGVSLGTTWGEVSDQGIIPARWKPTTGSGSDEALRQEEWDKAMQFVQDNIDEEGFDYEFAEMWLRRLAPNLTDSDVRSIIEQAELMPRKEREKYEQFITTDYIKTTFNKDDLEKATRGAGKAGGLIGIFVSDKEVNNYVNDLMLLVEKYREQKYPEKDIWNAVYEKIQSDMKGVGVAF